MGSGTKGVRAGVGFLMQGEYVYLSCFLKQIILPTPYCWKEDPSAFSAGNESFVEDTAQKFTSSFCSFNENSNRC